MTTDTKVADLPAAWRRTAKAASIPVAATFNACADELEAAIAARQPVGQEPVAEVVEQDARYHGHARALIHLRPENGLLPAGTKLYTAPPAQADLEQFREAVEYWRDSAERGDFYQQRNRADRLLALIDQQAGKADADSSEAPFLQRLRAEQRELADRHQKLEAFTTSPGFKSLDETNQMLLRRQENQQHNMLETLNQRIHHVAGQQGSKGVDRG